MPSCADRSGSNTSRPIAQFQSIAAFTGNGQTWLQLALDPCFPNTNAKELKDKLNKVL